MAGVKSGRRCRILEAECDATPRRLVQTTISFIWGFAAAVTMWSLLSGHATARSVLWHLGVGLLFAWRAKYMPPSGLYEHREWPLDKDGNVLPIAADSEQLNSAFWRPRTAEDRRILWYAVKSHRLPW